MARPLPLKTIYRRGLCERAPVVLNIGLERRNQEDIDPAIALELLKILAGSRVIMAAVNKSATEEILVVEVATPPNDWNIYELAEALEQEAIAVWDGKHGKLIGPEADKRQPFDPKQFLLINGNRLNS